MLQLCGQLKRRHGWRGQMVLLVIVMVFDPLAVTLVVAFNIALLRDGVEKRVWKMVVRPVMAVSIIFFCWSDSSIFVMVVCRRFRL